MGRTEGLPRLNGLAAAAGRVRTLAANDRALAAAALVAAASAAWRLSSVMSAAAAPVGAAPAAVAPVAAPPVTRMRPAPLSMRKAGSPAPAAGAARKPEESPRRADSPPPANDEVRRMVQRLLATSERRAELESALGRMSTYAPFIRAALRERGVPQDLLYLAMIESAYRPGAVSRAGATGMWQFMRGTGALYGLEVSPWVDERRDPIRSTQAAVRHLDELHREFGSWHLALAAYNAGPPRVWRALRRHAGGRSGSELLYWQIRPHLPADTRAYVPLFLAAAEIARRPEAYGLRPVPRPPLSFSEVWYPGGTSLAQIARERGVPAEQLLALNPHLVKGTTPPGRSWRVRVPLGTEVIHHGESE